MIRTSSGRAQTRNAVALGAVLVGLSMPAPVAGMTGGYVRADAPTTADYTPDPSRHFNSAGGPVHVRRLGPGSYEVRFERLLLAGGNVQATAAGDQGHRCTVVAWNDDPQGLRVTLGCVGERGEASDAGFSLLAVAQERHEGPLAYVWADQPSAPDYEPNRHYAFNSAGGAIRIHRVGRGQYDVTFARPPLSGGTVQVTPYGAARGYCNARRWTGHTASVACFDTSGHHSDSRFSLLFLDGASWPGRLSFAWADRPNVERYDATPGYSRNAAGKVNRIERHAIGQYTLILEGVSAPGGAILVTGHGHDMTQCLAGPFRTSTTPPTRVPIRCFRSDGRRTDSAFTVLHVHVAGPRDTSPAPASPLVSVDLSHGAFPSAWRGTMFDLEATLQADTRRSGDVVLDSMTWRCTERRCTTRGILQPTVDLCRSLATQVGRIARFGTAARGLSAAQITQCNEAVDRIPLVAGLAAFVRPQVLFTPEAAAQPAASDAPRTPGPLPVPLPLHQALLDDVPEIQDDLRDAVGWDYMVYPDGKDDAKFYFLPREYRIALLDEADGALALSFNYLYEKEDGDDVLMTAQLRPPNVAGDFRLLKALAEQSLTSLGARLELVPFPIESAEIQIADVLGDYGVDAAHVRVEAPSDVLDPIRLSVRLSEEAQQNLLAQLRTRHGIAGHVRLKAGRVVANVPLHLSLAGFSGAAVTEYERAREAGAIENRSPFDVRVKGVVAYVKAGERGVRRSAHPLARPLAIAAHQSVGLGLGRAEIASKVRDLLQGVLPVPVTPEGLELARVLAGVAQQPVVHAWLDYELDDTCSSCLDAIETKATTQSGLTRRAELVVEALPSIFSELRVEKVLVEVESPYFSAGRTPEVRTFNLYPDARRATARVIVARDAGADAEKGRYRFRAFAGGQTFDYSNWQTTSSLDITLTPHDVRPGASGPERKDP